MIFLNYEFCKKKVTFMAEREGFEPSVVLLLHTLSKSADYYGVKGLQRFFNLNFLLSGY